MGVVIAQVEETGSLFAHLLKLHVRREVAALADPCWENWPR